MAHDLKAMVKGDKTSAFWYYRDGQLWYKTDCGFPFPVPVDDIGDGTFNAVERSMLMMRYIRKQLAKTQEEDQTQIVLDDDGNPVGARG